MAKTLPDHVDNLDDNNLHFRVSTGLKNLIGKDLIVSDFVAIFELVKNSFDARARHVRLVFEPGAIWLIDDGKGMTFEDIKSKWLFVAYSAKRDDTEDVGYRDVAETRLYAGNKGVGRFSSDRLGAKLQLETKSQAARKGSCDRLTIEWDRFEQDQTKQFEEPAVFHETRPGFDMPEGERAPQNGTVLKIERLRDTWSRDQLLKLRGHLEKLINPFESRDESFRIALIAKHEQEADDRIAAQIKRADGEKAAALARRIVNGRIANFVFAELERKTTYVDVKFDDTGESLETLLVDRGKLIYRTKEPNPYKHLAKAGFTCRIFFLNTAAKQTFARRMGLPSVQFGSVFLFRNGFRVFPIGEEGDDSFELDRRKQQGYARYLGTRDIIGRIDVHGADEVFREATSRDQGLVRTAAYIELEDAFKDHCLRRLETYVVNVTWKDILDRMRDDASGLEAEPARARIIGLVAALARSEDIEVLEHAADIVNVLGERAEAFESSLADLRQIATSLDDKALARRIRQAESRFRELKTAEARAIAAAEKESAARVMAETRATASEQSLKRVETRLNLADSAFKEERKRNLFLTSISSLDHDTITNLHHQINIYASNIHFLIELQIEKLGGGKTPDRQSQLHFLENIRFSNQQVLAVSRLASRANFRMDADVMDGDLAAYIAQYMTNVSAIYEDRIQFNVGTPERAFDGKFKPIEIAIVIDNLVTNAMNFGATTVNVSFKFKDKTLQVAFVDDGRGFGDVQEIERMFEKGFSTTRGSGLGLFHARQVMQSMNGAIEARRAPIGEGAAFILAFPSLA